MLYSGNTFIKGTLDVAGATTLESTLLVSDSATFNGAVNIKNDLAQPEILWYSNDSTGNLAGKIFFYMKQTNSTQEDPTDKPYRTDKFTIRQYSYDSSTNYSLSKYETYSLPSVTSDLQSNSSYRIVTTKGADSQNSIPYRGTDITTVNWLASNNGALYATSENGALSFGTLPVGQGGTFATSHTGKRLVYSNSDGTSISAYNAHYADGDRIAVNSTSQPSYNFYVNGTSYHNGNDTHNGDIIVESGNVQQSRLFVDTVGSSSVSGTTILELGNNKSSNTDKNSYGIIRLYGTDIRYTDIITNATNYSKKFYLPNYTGDMYAAHVGNDTNAVGSNTSNTSQPVYVAAGGRITAITNAIDVTYGGTGASSHTGYRLVYSNSGGTSISAYDAHYADSAHIAINSTSQPSQNFYVNGTSYHNGNDTHAGNLLVSANDTYQLGTSSNRWTQGYFTTALWIGSNQQTVAASAENALYLGTGVIRITRATTEGGLIISSNATQYGRFYVGTQGVAQSGSTITTGITYLIVGNNIDNTLDDNSCGILRLYSAGTNGVHVRAVKNNDITTSTFYIPAYDSTMYAVHSGSSGAGNSTTPVYVESSGHTAAITGPIGVSLGGTGASSFTANSVIISGSSTTSALTTRAITNNTSAQAVTANTNIITANTLYYHTGNSNITTVGTISTGTWQGSTIGVEYGGTGATSFTANRVIMSGSTTTSALTTRAITNNTSAQAVTASTNLITANTLYYHSGNSNITTVGTIGSGTWQGSAVGVAYGGTGKSSFTASTLLYASAATTIASSSITSNGGYLANVTYLSLNKAHQTDYRLWVQGNQNIVGAISLQHETLNITDSANGVTSAVSNNIYFNDKGGRYFGRVFGWANQNGVNRLYLYVGNWYKGSTDETAIQHANGIYIQLDKSGNLSYSVAGAAAFRTAIGVGTAGTRADSYFVQRAGDTMTGTLTLKQGQWKFNGVSGLDANNSDIININALYYTDLADDFNEGIHWYRNGTNWDNVVAASGKFYFSANKAVSAELNNTNSNAQLIAGRFTTTSGNDYAECRLTSTNEPGRCVTETSSGIMVKTNKRLLPGCKVISDTYGNCIGATKEDNIPIAISGRVLVYPYRAREEYTLGAAVCSAPDGTVDIMTRDEIMMYPERIVGTVSEIPTYDKWYNGQLENNEINVDGRIWIYVR